MPNEKKKPAAKQAPAAKKTQDLKVKALQAKAKAAKSKATSSRMRDENTPMPLAKGQPVARGQRAMYKAVGMSGKDIMKQERKENRMIERDNPDVYKKNKTQSEKADSAFLTSRTMDALGGTRKIQYKEVRKSKK